jgi:hypothetical protein
MKTRIEKSNILNSLQLIQTSSHNQQCSIIMSTSAPQAREYTMVRDHLMHRDDEVPLL